MARRSELGRGPNSFGTRITAGRGAGGQVQRRPALPGDRFADGGDYLGGPEGQGLVGGGVVGAAVDEAGRAMVQDGGGELVDPLPDGAADPAAVLAPGGGERFEGDAAAEVVDADDLRQVPGRRGRGGVDAGARLAVELAQPVRASRRDPAVGQLPGMTRPPDSADSEVSVRARTGAGRLGRLVVVTMPVMRTPWPSRNPVRAYASSLSPKYGWSATVNRSKPSRSAWVASRTRPAASAASAPFHWPREAPNRTS
jgi:hypothetical protein